MALPLHNFRLGPMRLTPYGVGAIFGVLAAMALSGRAARRIGVDPEHAWDAGLFAVLSCFLGSRLLLILSDPVAFVHFPVLVLSLPSLTIAGILVAATMTLVYLRRRKMPILSLLDAFAPSGAFLAASLETGHWIDGSELGMPRFRGYTHVLTGFFPVTRYGVLLSFAIALLLWVRLGRESKPGRVAALGLLLGGLAAFGLDMLSLPTDLFDRLWLEPGQIVALGAVLAGACLWTFAPEKQPLTAPDQTSQPQSSAQRLRETEHSLATSGEVR